MSKFTLRRGFVVVLLLVLILTIDSVECKKKKKSKKAKKPQVDSLTRKPKDTDPVHYCHACQAITRALTKNLGKKTSQVDVVVSMSELCRMENMNTYDYPPPKMIGLCNLFMSGWEEELETYFIKRDPLTSDAEQEFCFEQTKVCNESLKKRVDSDGVNEDGSFRVEMAGGNQQGMQWQEQDL